MAIDFSKFDSMVDKKKLADDLANAANQEFDEVPKGTYVIGIDKMEIRQTKNGDGLLFFVQAAIKETVSAPKKQDNRKIFFNRKIYGNKPNEKGTWNDGVAISGVISWVKKLTDEDLEFSSYGEFANDILDIFQDVCPHIEAQIDYDPEAFSPISIKEVFDV